ncbi:MAG: methyltransferase domain-containing protein, partial [Planctomycetes bacterium]|nr:methyltransferase domain-containing protein [Planctomycetota bacterium]
MKCRHCSAEVSLPLIDLGAAPPSNAYLRPEQLQAGEVHLPLRVLVCTRCWLAQTADHARADALFTPDYAYFSSYSSSWVRHAAAYVERMRASLGLGAASHVVEVACNDGYLLRHVRDRGIPCLGIEPTAGTAAAARSLGIEVREAFFGRALATELAAEGRSADLMVANNVLAHVPDINDFIAGFAILLKPDGVATFEFPHLRRLVEGCQFDTVYHEHFSYLSLLAVATMFTANGLEVIAVEELPTHGGSLRVHAQRGGGPRPVADSVARCLQAERDAGMARESWYLGLQPA